MRNKFVWELSHPMKKRTICLQADYLFQNVLPDKLLLVRKLLFSVTFPLRNISHKNNDNILVFITHLSYKQN